MMVTNYSELNGYHLFFYVIFFTIKLMMGLFDDG